MPHRSLLLSALLLLPVAPACLGQTLGLRSLNLGKEELPEVFVRGEENHILLRFSRRQPTKAVEVLRANTTLPIYRRETNEDGEETFAVADKVKVPSGAKGILLLAWAKGDGVRYVAIEDNFAAARFDRWLLINAGSRPVALQVGEGTKPVVIKPGSSTTHKIEAPGGNSAQSMKLHGPSSSAEVATRENRISPSPSCATTASVASS